MTYNPARRGPQTRAEQDRYLAAATADGSLHQLYWYIVAGDSALAIPAPDRQTASVPVTPAGPDIETQRHWAHLMLAVAQSYHPAQSLRLELTTTTALAAVAPAILWHTYGSEDHICPSCAAINNHCHCPAIHTTQETHP